MKLETIPALLANRAQLYATKEAVVDHHARITYAQLEDETASLAASLVAAGVNKGHHVGLMMPNSVEWVVQAYALMRIGAVLVPLSTMLRPKELEQNLAIAGVRHLIATPQFNGRSYREDWDEVDRSALPSLTNIWWTDKPLPKADANAEEVAKALAANIKPADDMVIIFTTGSSGLPKGVLHTHGGAIRANKGSQEIRKVEADTRLYLPMPLFWAGGFTTGLISALNAGCTLLTEAIPEPTETLQFLAREKVTLFRGWLDQAARIASHPDFARTDLSSLKPGSLDAIMPGQSPPPGARAYLFGMTESFGPYSGYWLDRELPRDKYGSCGVALGDTKLRIADPDTGAILGHDCDGSIQIGGPNILKGICGREREDVFTADGWYDTGDIGRLDADGFLFFNGRRDNMVKISGATAYPIEVETVLRTIPGVKSAAVCDILIGDEPRFGAAVVIKPDMLSIEDLVAIAHHRLSSFKVPKRWLVLPTVDQLPRLTSGKVDRPALRTLINEHGTTMN